MKVNLSYKILGIWLLFLPLFYSCSTADATDMDITEKESMLVTFSLDVQSQSGSRATDDNTWGGNYPSIVGTDFENKIETSTLVVFAYKTDGTFVAELPILQTSTDNNGKVNFTCALPETIPYVKGESYRYMVIANCTNKNYGISYTNGVPNLEKLTFATPFTVSIPMWGVKTYQFPATLPADHKLDLGDISLLRATAKVGVKLADALKEEGYAIKELKLNYANANGYSVPEQWQITASTELLEHDEVFRPNTTAGFITNVNATTMGVETGAYYIYVPETTNDATNHLSIAVTLTKDGEDVEFPYENGIRFCNYADGQPSDDLYNIVRNHFYDYTITAVNVGLKMNLVVAEWEDEPIWDLDFTAPIHTKLMTAPDDEAAVPTEEPTMFYDNSDESGEAGAFVGYFKMESPEGISWRPTLANASATDYEVRVYRTDELTNVTEQIKDNEIKAEQDQFYKIVVVPLNAENEGNVIKLGLTYVGDWNIEPNPTLLIINKGDNKGLYYPWNSSKDKDDDPDIHWVSIKQVGKPI